MTIAHDVVGRRGDLRSIRWTERDVLVYAVGIGAPPALRVYPTFAAVAGTRRSADGRRAIASIGEFDHSMLVHGTESITLHAPIPLEGEATTQDEIVAIHDKGTGALVTIEHRVQHVDGSPLWTERVGVFIRGEGGWGGDRGSINDSPLPERPPDRVTALTTTADQALLYRLSGDGNPLHFDPAFARRAGFPSPILHGLCTYAFAGRALIGDWCADDAARLGHLEGRFVSPVYPGETLEVRSWNTGPGEARFVVRVGDRTVFDRGVAGFQTAG